MSGETVMMVSKMEWGEIVIFEKIQSSGGCHSGRAMTAITMRSNRTNIRKGVALFIKR